MQIGQRVSAQGQVGRINTIRANGTVDIACEGGGSLEGVDRRDVEVLPIEESETTPVSHAQSREHGSQPPPQSAPPEEAPATKAVEPDDLTVAELKAELEARGVEYDTSDKKDDLVKLLKKAIKSG